MVDLANTWARDFITAGIPASGVKKPEKAKIREWGTYIESLTMAANYGNTVWFATKALLTADLAHAAGVPAIVYADTTAANNGIYIKAGASGAGSWGQIITYLPGYQFVTATDAGAGTANAIVATSSPLVTYTDGVQLIRLNIFETNTSGTVTVAFDGGAALAVKTVSGANPAIGGLTGGMTVIGVVDASATQFRLISELSSQANFDHQGDWSAIVTYTENQVVTGSDGYWYQLKTASALNDNPVSGGSGDWLQILASAGVADGAVTTVKLADGSVTQAKLEALLQQIIYQKPLNALTFPSVTADDVYGSGTDNTTALTTALGLLSATWAGTVYIPYGVRFDTQAVVDALPENAVLDYVNVIQTGSGYREVYRGYYDNPPDANTDHTFVVGSTHVSGIALVNDGSAGTASANSGLSYIGYGRGFYEDTKRIRYMYQDDYGKSTVRLTEYGSQGIFAVLSRMRAPWRARGFEIFRDGLTITTGQYYLNIANSVFYQATSSGTIGATFPTHTSGTAAVGGINFAFDNNWQYFKPNFYRDEMSRVGSDVCDTGITQYWHQNPEDTESFYARWRAEGISKTVTFDLAATNGSGTALTSTIVADSSGNLKFTGNGGYSIRLETGGSLIPLTDNWSGLGGASNRYFDVWAVDGTINTSDARFKTKPRKMNAVELKAARELGREIGIWKWLDHVEKHGDEAVMNCGVTVQRVAEIMESHGLDPWAYGFVRYDAWDAVPAEYDKRGNEVQPAKPAGDIYSLRPSQFLMFVMAGMADLEARIAALEAA